MSDKSVAAATITTTTTTCERTGDFPQLEAIKCPGVVTRLISIRADSGDSRTDSVITGTVYIDAFSLINQTNEESFPGALLKALPRE